MSTNRVLLLLSLAVPAALPSGCAAPADEGVSSLAAALTAAAPPEPVGASSSPPFVVEPVTLPAPVERFGGGFWLDDGKILSSVRVTGEDGGRLAVLDPARGAVTCLTCGRADLSDLGRPQPFADGRRILAQSPSSSNVLRDFEHWILTCTPSIGDCAKLTAERLDGLGDSPTALQERWPAISPDGAHLAWTRLSPSGYRILFADLVRDARGYRAVNLRVLNPAAELDTVAGVIAAAAWYEVKGFTEDGGGLLVGSTRGGSLNLDAFQLDLATGRWTRFTSDPDWDEDHELSPDGRWLLIGSARGEDTLTPLSLAPLPPLLDFALIAPVTYYHIGGSSRRSGQRRLWRFPLPEGDLGPGQLLAPSPTSAQVLATGPELSGDGQRILFGQRTPGANDRQLLIGRFSAAPLPPVAVRATPEPRWAPRVEDAPALPAILDKTLPGPRGGTVAVSWQGGVLGGSFRAEYDGFITEEGLILDGAQAYLGGPTAGHYTADVQLSGTHHGRAQADLLLIGTWRSGHAAAELDGRRAAGRW